MNELEYYFYKNGCTKAETIVCMNLMTGMSNGEIANHLFVTEKSVKFHVTNIYKKLKLRSRAQFLAKYWEMYSGMVMLDKNKNVIPMLHLTKGPDLPMGPQA